MDINQPISSIMSESVYTVSPKDKLQVAKDVFDTYPVHHVVVMDNDQLVGIMSNLDLMYFLRPIDPESNEKYINRLRLKNYTIEEVMTKEVVTINAEESIMAALELLNKNVFHALPVMKGGALCGIMTTHDIIASLLESNKKTVS